MTSAGMEVTLRVDGQMRALPGSTELCCYRVVQEALTNAGRHARGDMVAVTVTFREETVSCTITNSTATVDSGSRPGGERGGGSRGRPPSASPASG